MPKSESELDTDESTRSRFMGAFLKLLTRVVSAPSESELK